MSKHSLDVELRLASVLTQPQLMFLLWAIAVKEMVTEDEFHLNFGDELPTKTLIRVLKKNKLIFADKFGHLELSDSGFAMVSPMVDDTAFRPNAMSSTRTLGTKRVVGTVIGQITPKRVIVLIEPNGLASLELRTRRDKRLSKRLSRFHKSAGSKSSHRVIAADENDLVQVGDRAIIMAIKPLIDGTRWRVIAPIGESQRDKSRSKAAGLT